MNQLMEMRTAKIMCAAVAGSFFVIHIGMFVLFFSCGVMPMVYFNVLSLAFYAASFILIWKNQLRVFSVAVYIEVLLHMTLAALFTGWGNGFQVTLVGLSALLYFAEYMGHALGIKHVHALPLCALGMCMYLGTFVVLAVYPAPYTLPSEVTFWLQIAWGIIVFVVSVSVLEVFVRTTFRSEATLANQLEHDKLTGLPNRYRMARYLGDIAAESGLEGYWVAMIDIDDFKKINDTYGHNCGDFVLHELAVIMADNRAEAEICRWGGEEFLLVGQMGECDSLEDLRSYFERIRKAICDHTFWYEERRLNLSVTIGVAQYCAGQNLSEWINAADKKLYSGKASGKNQVLL